GREVGADVRTAEKAALALRRAEIVAEKLPREGGPLPAAAADARPGAEGDDERDDRGQQDQAENDAEMVLKISLDPGDHGGKNGDARSPAVGGKGEVGS